MQTLELTQQGQPLTLREALPIPAPTADRRGLWLWYYDTPNHHLVDLWLWYLMVAQLPAGVTALLLVLIGLPALLCTGLGLHGMITCLRQPASYCG
ncbi:MAG: hypothetical protein HC837_10005 [Chloroflexaceae bacterium]|nr:hypothetical protein [Chloroflexaceae bacterium]